MKRVLITICGRAGSKGFKNKNLKTFLDKPLVYYTHWHHPSTLKKRWKTHRLMYV